MNTQTYDVTYYDVWADAEGGWTANCSVVGRYTITVPENASDATIERRARAVSGFTGRRTIRDCDGCITRWVDPHQAVAVELSWGH